MFKIFNKKKKFIYSDKKRSFKLKSFFKFKKKITVIKKESPYNKKRLFIFNSNRGNFWRRFLIKLSYFLLFILFISLIFIFFFTSFFVIKNINLERENIRIDSGKIVDFLKDYQYKNILFVSINQIEKDLSVKFPEYEEIEVQRIFPSSLLVKVKNVEIVAQAKIYIKTEIKTFNTESLIGKNKNSTQEQFLALNANGILEENSDNYKDLPIIEVQKAYDLPLVQGERLLERKELDLILESKRKLFEELKINSNHIIYFNTAREIHLKTDVGYEIWIDFMTQIGDQIDKLKKSSNDVDWIKDPPKEHIDLRVKNRIIYK